MSQKYVCVHGHFYQPPRENPWLEDVEVQDSARPYHDWNERITLESYAPNTASRVLDRDGHIAEIVNNYEKISFNFGPTLLAWMERQAPDVYRRVIDSDRASRAARSGHGNALAQVYNHVIMPLASRRDKVTQVVWGIRDFQRRFGRAPEGMWLAETAVDTETLEVLAEFGIKFTILSPSQALRVRTLGGGDGAWRDVSGGRVDPSCAYRWTSPRGHTVSLFFYDGPISRAVAFEGLLGNGEYFAGRLMEGFSDHRERPQLVNVATDGESYGHHHRFGDMALAYALRKIEADGHVRLTNYGEFLELHPAAMEAEIAENSSWSCFHGVERWRADCGCRLGGHAHWTQQWRGPLRDSLDRLRDALDPLFDVQGRRFFRDPWRAREDYVEVIADRSPAALRAFLDRHQAHALDAGGVTDALRLLEMQRHRLYMYTSCGWFFDELSGIESVTVQLSAARAIQLAQTFPGGAALEEEFVRGLSAARSNIAEYKDGAGVYRRLVRPVAADLARVAAHEALRGLFDDGAAATAERRLHCYAVASEGRARETAGGHALAVGRVRVTSEVTGERFEAGYAVLHLGGHDFHAVLKPSPDPAAFDALSASLRQTFHAGTVAEVLQTFARNFEPRVFGLQDMFLEDRRRVLTTVIDDILKRYDSVYRQMVNDNRKLINYLADNGFPVPEAFRLAMRYILDNDLERELDKLDGGAAQTDRLAALGREAERFDIDLDWTLLTERLRRTLEARADEMLADPDPARARAVLALLDLADRLELKVWLWRVENAFYELWTGPLRERLAGKPPDDPAAGPFRALAERLRFRQEHTPALGGGTV